VAQYFYKVAYDDGDCRWHSWNLPDSYTVTVLGAQTRSAEDVEMLQWERFELRCCVSHARLTHPARLVGCRHRAACNADTLLEYLRQPQTTCCPIAGCDARYMRRHDLVRDDALTERIAAVPRSTTIVWMRGALLQTEPPDAPVAPTKRSNKRTRVVDSRESANQKRQIQIQLD
jgi:hypothetical protein